ncbi:zinc finger protein 800-like [Oppia nitens]|uniref:zinc finger protein 800-like n=1 Tax=Oppia nitens TaxID=1686743 RepID=UPI0023DA57A5|nr:zinc finger protein 800-like [Oppia nitens]
MGKNRQKLRKTQTAFKLLVPQNKKLNTQLTNKTTDNTYCPSKILKPVLSTGSLKVNSDGEAVHDSVSNDDRYDDNIDHSLTREPINLGVKNVRQILNCIKDSSVEVKDLILNECNIIYECKICTNLFRSLANFISHKRFYCKNHYCERMLLFDSTQIHFNDEEEEMEDNCDDNDVVETVIHTQQTPEPEEAISGNTSLDIISPMSSSSATNSCVENVNPNDNQLVIQKCQFIDKCLNKVNDEKQRHEESPQLELQLSTIKSNSNAVFQSLQDFENNSDCNENNTNCDKKQIINNLFKEMKNFRQMSEKLKRQRVEEILPPVDNKIEVNDNINQNQLNQTLSLKCDLCPHLSATTFSSTKTLRVHMKTIHSTRRIVYPCPLCSLAFKQLSNATRHLIQIHKRTKTQAITLKEVMKRRAYSTNSSGNSSEIEEVSDESKDGTNQSVILKSNISNESTMGSAKRSTSNQNSISNKCKTRLSSNVKPSASRINAECIYKCGVVFDWAPAKRSHEKSCRKRLIVKKQIRNHQINGNSSKSKAVNNVVKSVKSKYKSQSKLKSASKIKSSSVPNYKRQMTISTTLAHNLTTNFVLPNSIEEKIKEFTDLKSLQCSHCPNQDFMSLNQLLQHAVTHLGYNILKCHGCSYHSIYENDMKYHLINTHNINEQMIGKHYQTLPNLIQPRLVILPIKSTIDCDDNCNQMKKEAESPEKNSKLKIHLRTSASKLGNKTKKCYEIVDK